MGQNLILNMADHGYKVVAYNRTVSKVDEFLNDAAKGHSGLLDLFYFDLVARGIWFAKRGMMALSISDTR